VVLSGTTCGGDACGIAAMDFFKVEVMTLIGPVRYSVLVVMDLKTRHIEVAGIVREAYEEWMVQVLRNLTDVVDGFLLGKTPRVRGLLQVESPWHARFAFEQRKGFAPTQGANNRLYTQLNRPESAF
jgi:hypothetical protein